MSNIIKQQNDLIILSDIIKYVSHHDLSEDYIAEILKCIIPSINGETLIGYQVKEKGIETALFDSKYGCIRANLNQINNWLAKNTNDFEKNYHFQDTNILKAYLFIFMITHEIEHSYQYLMAKGVVDAPCKMIQSGYQKIFALFNRNSSIIPRPIKETRELISYLLYKFNENFFILERNANVEATDLLSQLAVFTGRDDIYNIFNEMNEQFTLIGYFEDSRGSLKETYQKILLYDKYKKFFEQPKMSEEAKMRYGLTITEDTRHKILKKK